MLNRVLWWDFLRRFSVKWQDLLWESVVWRLDSLAESLRWYNDAVGGIGETTVGRLYWQLRPHEHRWWALGCGWYECRRCEVLGWGNERPSWMRLERMARRIFVCFEKIGDEMAAATRAAVEWYDLMTNKGT